MPRPQPPLPCSFRVPAAAAFFRRRWSRPWSHDPSPSMTSAAAPDPHHRQRAPVARSPDPVSTRQAPPRAWQYASPPAPSFPAAWVCPRLVLRWGCSKIAAAAAVRSVSASSTWPPRKPPYGIARLTPMASPASRSSASFAPGQGLCRPLCPAAALLVLRRRRPPVVVGPSSSCTVAILSHLGQDRDRQVPDDLDAPSTSLTSVPLPTN